MEAIGFCNLIIVSLTKKKGNKIPQFNMDALLSTKTVHGNNSFIKLIEKKKL